jgi:Raf kinase inhibitor-like YbhB/YbcL family protein
MIYRITGMIVPLALAALIGCADANRKDPLAPDPGVASMQLTSTAFKEGDTIPKDYTADGKDVSPPLAWSGQPNNTKSFALICDDPDAPRGTWTHWVLFNIPASRHELPEGVPVEREVLDGARQGSNSFKKLGYGGPNPPPGKPHRYIFTIFALDTQLELQPGVAKQEVEKAMKGHILAEGKLMGKFGH